MKVRTARFLAWAGVSIAAAEVIGAFAIGAAAHAIAGSTTAQMTAAAPRRQLIHA